MSIPARITRLAFLALALASVCRLGAEDARPATRQQPQPHVAAAGTEKKSAAAEPRERAEIGELRFAAENALLAGLPSLAADFARRALEDKSLSNAERDRLLLTLSAAQLAAGDYAAVSALLPEISGDSPRKRLREAFVELARGNAARAAQLLTADVPADAFPQAERAWLSLAKALAETALGNDAAAETHFAEAEKSAVREAVREHVAFMRTQAQLAASAAPLADAELALLRQQRDEARGTPHFADAAKLYIVALAKSGRRAEALAALRESLPVPEKDAPDFALLEGLLEEDIGSETARYAFERAIRARPPRSRQAAAFSGLLQNVRALKNAGKKDDAVVAANAAERFLAELPPDERALDLELFTRARIAYEVGNLRLAQNLAEDLRSRFPASPYVPDALRLLVGIAVSGKEYRRAVPLLETLRATEMSAEDALFTDILAADCNFLAEDYALAADAYRRAVAAGTLEGDRLGAVFFQQALSDIRSGNVAAAAELTASPLAERVPAGWKMRTECVVVEALRKAGLFKEAAARAEKFLASEALPDDFRVRMLWEQALAALELNDSETASRAADLIAAAAADFGETVSAALRETVPDLLSRSLLIKARASFLSGEDAAEGLELLGELRERWPESAAAAASWLEEGRVFEQLGKPARALVCYETLIERYGEREEFSEYAAIAAFEAAQAAATIGRPDEAVKHLQWLIARCPKNPLTFYARMRQADFFRILNDFDSALVVYDGILSGWTEREEMRIVEMRRADTLRALAARAEADGDEKGAFADARSRAESAYERLFSLPDQPLSLKAEAGFKWGDVAARATDASSADAAAARERAEARARMIFWKAATDTMEAARERGGADALGETGGYWVARCLFALAASCEKQGDYAAARNAYGLIVEWSSAGLIPGRQYAETRLARIAEK